LWKRAGRRWMRRGAGRCAHNESFMSDNSDNSFAVIVFAPEAISALRAALDNQLQRSINLCLGAAASTIGLTVPAILGIGIVTGKPMILGLDPTGMTLLVLTLLLSTLTFSGPRPPFWRGQCI
jgi:Ca2+:H+ antiporter